MANIDGLELVYLRPRVTETYHSHLVLGVRDQESPLERSVVFVG